MKKNKYQQEIMALMNSFRKLRVAKLIPELNPGEVILLQVISHDDCEEGCSAQGSSCTGTKAGPGVKASIRVSDIVKKMKAPAPAVSRGLSSLEDRGLIKREIDASDRRNTLVSLTKKGEKMCAKIDNTFNEYMDAVFGRLEEKEIRQGIAILSKMLNAATEELEARGGGNR